MELYLKIHKIAPWLSCIVGVVLFILSSCGSEVKLPQEILESQPAVVEFSPNAQQGYLGEPVSVSVSIPALLSTSPSQDVIGSNIFFNEDDAICVVVAEIISPSGLSIVITLSRTTTTRYTGTFVSSEVGLHAVFVSFGCTVDIDGEIVTLAEGETQTDIEIIYVTLLGGTGPPGSTGPEGSAAICQFFSAGPPFLLSIIKDPRRFFSGFTVYMVWTFSDVIDPTTISFTADVRKCNPTYTACDLTSIVPLTTASPGSTIAVSWNKVYIMFGTKTTVGFAYADPLAITLYPGSTLGVCSGLSIPTPTISSALVPSDYGTVRGDP